MFFSGLFQRKVTRGDHASRAGGGYRAVIRHLYRKADQQPAGHATDGGFSCVRVLAESVGMLPCNLYHLNGSLKQRATGERLHKLISTHPNGYMTPQEFWELVVTCLCLRETFTPTK